MVLSTLSAKTFLHVAPETRCWSAQQSSLETVGLRATSRCQVPKQRQLSHYITRVRCTNGATTSTACQNSVSCPGLSKVRPAIYASRASPLQVLPRLECNFRSRIASRSRHHLLSKPAFSRSLLSVIAKNLRRSPRLSQGSAILN